MEATIRCTRKKYVCANDRIKLIGTTDGYFPDFGHHSENEMGGLWMHPIKLLDGFWMKFTDYTAGNGKIPVDGYILADEFINYPYKNEFLYQNGLGHTTISIKRSQIAPEGICGIRVDYLFKNNGDNVCKCSASFLARTDLRPVWLGEEAGLMDGTDDLKYEEEYGRFIGKDSNHSWFVVIGADNKPDALRSGQFFGPEVTNGNGISCQMSYDFTLHPEESKTLTFYIAGSDCSEEEAVRHWQRMKETSDPEAVKVKRYNRLMESSQLNISDERFQEIYQWVKVNTDWLIVETSKNGRGIAAGLPEYPWWFGCDSFYTLQGVLCLGDYKLCKDTLLLIHDYSVKQNGNGRIVHEVLTSGYCPNLGNTQETAHFITMVWKYYEWTKDAALLHKTFEYMKKSVEWLQEQDDDGDLFPSGYGIIEIAGLNMEMIDTAVYTYEAYKCFSEICCVMNEKELGMKYSILAERLKVAINTCYWDEEVGLYCDAHTSYHALEEKRDILEKQLKLASSQRIKEYMERLLQERCGDKERERGWLLNRNWIINTPMEVGMAPVTYAERALETLHTEDYIGTYGMYLDGLKQDSTMTISTGVMAVAQGQYGHSDRALELIERMFLSFGAATPGSISEMSPDYGCFAQGWTVYSVMVPIVRHFFGIRPCAHENIIRIQPNPPSKWKKGSLKRVKVMEGELDMEYERMGELLKIKIKNRSGVPIEFISDSKECSINGEYFLLKDGSTIIATENIEIISACCK